MYNHGHGQGQGYCLPTELYKGLPSCNTVHSRFSDTFGLSENCH